jgi:hypothetical protein
VIPTCAISITTMIIPTGLFLCQMVQLRSQSMNENHSDPHPTACESASYLLPKVKFIPATHLKLF